MADTIKKNYEPPQWYQDGMDGADEAGDLRFVHSSAAIVRIGEVPIVALENVSITVSIVRNPIMVIGSPVAIGFDFGGYNANISGQIVMNAASTLNKSQFFAKSVNDLVANINTVFDIDILAQDANAENVDERLTEPFIILKNCQNTGETINLSTNANIRQSFTAVATFMERDIADALKDFNKIAA
jgi:hypothetical protein